MDKYSRIDWFVLGTTRQETVREFNVHWKAECGQLNLAHVTENKTCVKTQTPVSKSKIREGSPYYAAFPVARRLH